MLPVDYADPFRLNLEWDKTVPIVRSAINTFIMALYRYMKVLSIHQLLNINKVQELFRAGWSVKFCLYCFYKYLSLQNN